MAPPCCAHDGQVGRRQRSGVDADQRIVDRPGAVRQLQLQEMAARPIIDPLAQVHQQHPALRLQPPDFLGELCDLAGGNIGDQRLGLGQLPIAGSLDVAHDAPIALDDARRTGERDPLRR